MPEDRETYSQGIPRSIDLSEEDVYDAMKELSGYLDITPGDFRDVYRHAYRHAVERITRTIKARHVMTREVVFVHPEATAGEVALLMARHGISGLPVLDQAGRVKGVISEKDFLSHMAAGANLTFMEVVAECLEAKRCAASPVRTKTAAEIMTSPAITVGEDTPIMDIADLLVESNINRVPVVDQDGGLKGIVSREDLVKSITFQG